MLSAHKRPSLTAIVASKRRADETGHPHDGFKVLTAFSNALFGSPLGSSVANPRVGLLRGGAAAPQRQPPGAPGGLLRGVPARGRARYLRLLSGSPLGSSIASPLGSSIAC